MRTIVYIDGFNLYYGALKGTPYRWLDILAMARKILRNAQFVDPTDNAARGISASDVFRHVGFSRTLVERAFRDNMSSPVQKQIVQARIDEAKRLLGSTALPIKEVATLSGFSSLEYLSRAFAAATGLSPTAWRERF